MEIPISSHTISGGIIIYEVWGEHWAITYTGSTIMADIFYVENGHTQTRWNLYASTTEQECIDKREEITGAT